MKFQILEFYAEHTIRSWHENALVMRRLTERFKKIRASDYAVAFKGVGQRPLSSWELSGDCIELQPNAELVK